MLKFMEELQINCKVGKSGCCVLCDRVYRESHVWP